MRLGQQSRSRRAGVPAGRRCGGSTRQHEGMAGRRTGGELDHLARLLLTGGPAWGAYVPQRFELHSGAAGTDARVVHLHEAHHAALNDSTAWGTALHLLARMPEPFHDAFALMLDACRRVHESFATFASVSLLTSHGDNPADLLTPYPLYVPLYESVLRGVSAVDGPNRRYLLATCAARASMQSPVLDLFTGGHANDITPSALRGIDTPDGRWAWLVSRPPGWWLDVARQADDAVRRRHGEAALMADAPDEDPTAAVAEEHDPAWASWELAAYDVMGMALESVSATVLDFNGHQEPTAAAVDFARSIDPAIGLQAAPALNAARDDRALASAVVEQARHVFGGPEPWRARLIDVPPAELVQGVEETSHVADLPFLVVSARLPTRLTALYRWDAADVATLAAIREPLAAVRVIEPDGSDDLIAHARIQDVDTLRTIRERWGDRGQFLSCISASCLIDRDWQHDWLPSLLAAGRLAILIDIELDRFVHRWAGAGTTVRAAIIDITDTEGSRRGLGICAEDPNVLWVALGDELGMDLLVRQLRDTPRLEFESTAAHLHEWGDALTPLVTHLLATEPFFDLEGLEGYL